MCKKKRSEKSDGGVTLIAEFDRHGSHNVLFIRSFLLRVERVPFYLLASKVYNNGLYEDTHMRTLISLLLQAIIRTCHLVMVACYKAWMQALDTEKKDDTRNWTMERYLLGRICNQVTPNSIWVL